MLSKFHLNSKRTKKNDARHEAVFIISTQPSPGHEEALGCVQAGEVQPSDSMLSKKSNSGSRAGKRPLCPGGGEVPTERAAGDKLGQGNAHRGGEREVLLSMCRAREEDSSKTSRETTRNSKFLLPCPKPNVCIYDNYKL